MPPTALLFQLAGTMEDFFKEMSKLGPGIPANQERDLKDVWERHGMHIVGPPLKVSRRDKYSFTGKQRERRGKNWEN